MRRLAWAVIALQIAVLAWVAAEREWIMAKGTTVWLRTAPVDPRDLFRGDYVQLDYEIGRPADAVLAPVQDAASSKYSVVYASLATDAGGLARVQALSLQPPATGPFIRGRVGSHLLRDWRSHATVQYGIEKYFVPQGTGHAIENRRGERDGWQTPLEIAVALSGSGTAVITGHRWSPMGIRLDVLEAADNNRSPGDAGTTTQRRSPKLRMSLRNQGEAPVLLVDDARHCAFSLWLVDRSALRGDQPVPWATRDCRRWQHGALDWVVLAPGAVHSVEFDFADPDWAVQGSEGAVELADANRGWAQYRLVYAPPEAELPEGRLAVWQSALPSAAFNAGGRVD